MLVLEKKNSVRFKISLQKVLKINKKFEQVEDELGWARSGLGLPKLLGLATMADQSEIRIENFLYFFSDIKTKDSRGT